MSEHTHPPGAHCPACLETAAERIRDLEASLAQQERFKWEANTRAEQAEQLLHMVYDCPICGGHLVPAEMTAHGECIRDLEASLEEEKKQHRYDLDLMHEANGQRQRAEARAEKAEAELAEARGLINDAALMAADHADSVLFDLLKAGGSSSHVKCGVAECPTCNPAANPPAPAKEG